MKFASAGLFALIASQSGAQSLPTTQRSFWAEGADTAVGLGARYNAMGGVGTSLANDLYAAYYNPAGLSELKGFSFAASTQGNAKYHNFSFLGLGYGLPIAESSGYKVGIALVYYPRVHAHATGQFTGKQFESTFIRYLLPGIPDTFTGTIDSKTKSYRLASGVQATDQRWSLGAYVEHIDCRSNFCGVHAKSNGFTIESTGAKAYGVGIGGRYQFNGVWQGGFQISDLNTKLDVTETTTDNLGTRTHVFKSAFPRRVTLELNRQIEANWLAAIQYDNWNGRYGNSTLDIQIIRLGTEYQMGPWSYRAGAMIPLRVHSDQSDTVKLPFPFSPTIGLGWTSQYVDLAMSLTSHPVMSVHKDKAAPTLDFSATFKW